MATTGVFSATDRAVLDALEALGTATMREIANHTRINPRTVRSTVESFCHAARIVRDGATGRGPETLYRLARPGEVLPLPEPEPDPPEAEIAVYRKRLEVVARVSLAAWRDETHPLLGRDLREYLDRLDRELELEGVA